jgi:hypothetical protein
VGGGIPGERGDVDDVDGGIRGEYSGPFLTTLSLFLPG